MTAASIYVRGGWLTVWGPYDAKDALKELPGREWDPQRKAWIVPTEHLDRVERIMRRYCTTVHIDQDPRERASSDWMADAFAAVGPDHRRKLYRVLAAALHPDHGGDTQTMQRLNAEYEWHASPRRTEVM